MTDKEHDLIKDLQRMAFTPQTTPLQGENLRIIVRALLYLVIKASEDT